jgi:hypothetical protein
MSAWWWSKSFLPSSPAQGTDKRTSLLASVPGHCWRKSSENTCIEEGKNSCFLFYPHWRSLLVAKFTATRDPLSLQFPHGRVTFSSPSHVRHHFPGPFFLVPSRIWRWLAQLSGRKRLEAGRRGPPNSPNCSDSHEKPPTGAWEASTIPPHPQLRATANVLCTSWYYLCGPGFMDLRKDLKNYPKAGHGGTHM